MDKEFLLILAFRNLKARRLRTVLTLMGVIIGISAIVFLVSFAFGLERLVTREVTGGNAFQLIDVGTGSSQVVKLNQDSVNAFMDIQSVKSVEPAISVGAKAKQDDKEIDATVLGASSKYLEWSGIKPKWGEYFGEPISGSPLGEAIVNTAYAKFVGITDPSQLIGRTAAVDAIVPKETVNASEDKIVENIILVIRGIVKDDSATKVYTHYNDLTVLGTTSYSQVKVELTKSSEAKTVRTIIEGMGYKTEYVGDTIAQIEQVFNIFKVILAGFGLIALVVAALGMFNTLTISLLERIKEIALMKILGMKKRDINNIFLTESVLLGMTGGVFGMIWGIIFGSVANSILNHYAVRAGGEPVSIFYFSPIFMIGILAFSIALGFFTGIYPARRATKVNALDVLRYE
jgi:putative ABC transport system permease protein